jgi:uncharacterized protein (TIGR03067 family)
MTALLACLVLAAPADEPAPKDLQGAWVLDSGEVGGKPFPKLKGLKYSITGTKYTATLGERTETGSFTADPSKSPRQMDTTPADGPHKGTTMLAIYEVKGDTLKVCYDQSGKTRPAKFETSAETPTTILMVFKRAGKSSD